MSRSVRTYSIYIYYEACVTHEIHDSESRDLSIFIHLHPRQSTTLKCTSIKMIVYEFTRHFYRHYTVKTTQIHWHFRAFMIGTQLFVAFPRDFVASRATWKFAWHFPFPEHGTHTPTRRGSRRGTAGQEGLIQAVLSRQLSSRLNQEILKGVYMTTRQKVVSFMKAWGVSIYKRSLVISDTIS